MNLLQIRTQFVNESGRHDLVIDTTAYADNGANFYINAGQRLLDRLIQFDKESARAFRRTEAGDYGAVFQSCRVVEEVWVADLTDRWKIKKETMQELRRQCFNEPLGNIQQNEPSIWAPIWSRTNPDRITIAEMDVILGYADFPIGDQQRQAYNGIIWMPPCDGEYQIEIVGKFYSAELTDDDHISYWAEVHPELLVMAAMAVLEITYRNRQGFGDWMTSINLLLSGVEFDAIEQDIYDELELEG